MTTGNIDDKDDMNSNPLEDEVPEVLPESVVTPAYLQDPPPKGMSDLDSAKWSLLNGFTEASLIRDGAEQALIDQAADELQADGYRKKPSKAEQLKNFINKKTTIETIESDDDDTNGKGAKERRVTVHEKTTTVAEKRGGNAQIKSFAKGAPAEVILGSIALPDGMDPQFASGMKFGASMVIMGVRIGQDLAAAGIQYAKPLIELAKDMRAGEVAAAEAAGGQAASQAASEAAQGVMSEVAPYMSKLKELMEEEAARKLPTASDGEMRGMMMEFMKPLLKRITGKMTGMPADDGKEIPDGWTVKT